MDKIFDIVVRNGEKHHGSVYVGQLAHGAKVEIPVLVIGGKEAGPTLWLNGTIHGDELNGPQASWELFHELSAADIKGRIIMTPLSNPLAFEHRDKISDVDLTDMDTVFPGDPKGLFSQRIAHVLFEQIKKHADYLLNFHTLHSYFTAVPYTVSKIVPNADPDIVTKSRNMALAFGFETNCAVDLANAKGEMPGVTRGAMDITCMQHGIPAFMAEVGSGGKIDRYYVDAAKRGVLNLLKYLNMMDGERQTPDKQFLITSRKFLRSDIGGLVQMKVAPGNIVAAGDLLAEAHNFGVDTRKMSFEEKAYLIAVRENPVVNTGDRLAFIGTAWEEVK